MTKSNAPKDKPKGTPTANAIPDAPKELQIVARSGVSNGHVMGEALLHPLPRHASTAGAFAGPTFGCKEPNINDGVAVLTAACEKARDGDLSLQRNMLVAQSMTLDAMFSEMARRAALNMGEYLDASERYMRLAFKAQTQSRATIETLDRLVRGGEQVVRHIHVDNRGGQAMIADTINTGGHENGKAVGQPYAIESGTPSCGQPLRSANPEREAVPVAGDAERAL